MYRQGDKKVLKSVNYSPVDFQPLLGQYIVAGVPISQVARVLRVTVAGEEAAAKLDAIVRGDVFSAVRQQTGYVKTTRMLCKSEWVYEVGVVFDSAASYEAYVNTETDNGNTPAKAIQVSK